MWKKFVRDVLRVLFFIITNRLRWRNFSYFFLILLLAEPVWRRRLGRWFSVALPYSLFGFGDGAAFTVGDLVVDLVVGTIEGGHLQLSRRVVAFLARFGRVRRI